MQLKSVGVTEQAAVKFAESLGAKSLAEMRAKPGDELLHAAAKQNRGFAFGPNLDGYFLTSDTLSTCAKGEQSQIPLVGRMECR